MEDPRAASSSEEDPEYSSDEDIQAASTAERRQPQKVYRHEEIHDKLEEILWEDATFQDSQATTCTVEDDIADVEDDLQRELSFYNQALAGAQDAVQRMQEAGTPWLRPPDYFAEMVKSDDHMARIKEQLMYEQKQIEEAEERRKQREAKKSSKEMQAERRKDKAQAKKSSIAQVTKLRKQRQQSGFAGELDMDAELASMERRPKAGARRISESRTPMSKKREARNSKYGFGGRKRLQKQNDASSAADMNSYKSGRPGRKKKVGKGRDRLGKTRREAGRAKR